MVAQLGYEPECTSYSDWGCRNEDQYVCLCYGWGQGKNYSNEVDMEGEGNIECFLFRKMGGY